ncbi:DUF1611 domain-containing protein [Parvularcula flava]|uniref:DUF1611 domain-containing protein n=1 Tax=Aquisalinus luteolus TaxID=1566827 RepID=A0A8J3A079_9PROT|nr:DUF1611 domain-containing protein [Aquisalinus luteolus]NHK26446.1 DUF1611 domain-containing protein [Aquisalinus luteolus]GGH92358.1 hypothetical protein GCM10011355_01670 [Aquisalinus luteolus]
MPTGNLGIAPLDQSARPRDTHSDLTTALDLPSPYLLFLGDVDQKPFAKTAFGIRDWAPERCVGEYACEGNALSLDLPFMSPREARAKGARALVIGVASMGGRIKQSWHSQLFEAVEAGLDIVNGLHHRLASVPGLADAAAAKGSRLIDIRTPPKDLPTATGRKRSGKRLLTVGTDCALGKKYTALALTRAFTEKGLDADFRATGQTGIIIGGGGMPMDAVVSDFLAGAAEVLSPDAHDDHWDVIEGQGSLLHPTFAGVSLGLLHGSQPDVLVLCHQAGREKILGLEEDFLLPDLASVIDLNLVHARRTNAAARCAGISLNTAHLSDGEADAAIERVSQETGLPCADPIRGGARFDALVEACLTS